MKGIILAGGSGTRLYPLTLGVSKQLLPVYDKPMIYYPLSVLMLAGIREILIISTPEDLPSYRRLLGTGEAFGVQFQYAEQPKPEGLAQAFIIGRTFVGTHNVCLVLGDNIFYGQSFELCLNKDRLGAKALHTFSATHQRPQRYGVVEADLNASPSPLRKNRKIPVPSGVTGLYFYPNNVLEVAAGTSPARGELEITSVNDHYLQQQRLHLPLWPRLRLAGHRYPHSLAQAGNFVETIQKRQGLKIACPEEIAFRNGWRTADQLRAHAHPMRHNEYGQYILEMLII